MSFKLYTNNLVEAITDDLSSRYHIKATQHYVTYQLLLLISKNVHKYCEITIVIGNTYFRWYPVILNLIQ